MRRLGIIITTTIALVLPAPAIAKGTVAGATHAVVRAVAEEGGSAVYYGTPQVHCRLTVPSRFGCSFLNLTRGRSGRVSVSYRHGHYYVGEPRYEQRSPPPYEQRNPPRYEPLCGTAYTC